MKDKIRQVERKRGRVAGYSISVYAGVRGGGIKKKTKQRQN